MLEREEYIEQAYFFRILSERLPENFPLQDLMGQIQHELLATTKLPMAIDYMLAELRHSGVVSKAMKRMDHYFTPFQTYVMEAAEEERGRFDMRVAIEVLRHEAKYRSGSPTSEGLFMYQFETLSRNRLRYDLGLDAMAGDPIYNADWKEWIQTVRRQIGIVDFADMIFVRSLEYIRHRTQPGCPPPEPEKPILFGEKEGKIAWANREKDPMYLFAALQRHLGYPTAPRLMKRDETRELMPQLIRRMERLETRLRLIEEENREGIDITKFFAKEEANEKGVDA
ncbi:MAG: hypothetical protein H8E44_34460 [Planctomycetes bacterium]|nr:hypothetical protein [Planctomycetota bacterium]MBL7044078.1 hypothetical protein [Pirellulaceae bacterium]